MAQSPNISFAMRSTREAMEGSLLYTEGSLAHIEEQVKGIEQAVIEKPALAFDLAKTLIESVCKTVLNERSVSYEKSDDLPKLFKLATRTLPFLPVTASNETEARTSLEKTLSGLHTAVLGICELRNQCGFASHGSGTAKPALEGIQAMLVAEAADTIVGFLHRVYRQEHSSSTAPKVSFDDNPTFNKSLDETFGPFQIFEVEFRPSEVLFELEQETYRIYLTGFDDDDSETISSDSEEFSHE